MPRFPKHLIVGLRQVAPAPLALAALFLTAVAATVVAVPSGAAGEGEGQGGAGAAAEEGKTLRVSAPAEPWELVFPDAGFTVTADETNEEKKVRRFRAVDETGGFVVSVFMEPARGEGDSAVAREFYWERAKASPVPKEDVKLSERDVEDKALVEYSVPAFKGKMVNQKNVHVYMVRDKVWIELHVSKAGFNAEQDQPTFDRLVKELRITDIPTGH